jgi:hypothetical protein
VCVAGWRRSAYAPLESGVGSRQKASKCILPLPDIRHTFIPRLVEWQASDSTMTALAGRVSRAMVERYSHIRMEAKRRAVGTLTGADSDADVAQKWAHFFVSEKSDKANSLKEKSEPPRTRTRKPLSGHSLRKSDARLAPEKCLFGRPV